jgi:hypothetical protein
LLRTNNGYISILFILLIISINILSYDNIALGSEDNDDNNGNNKNGDSDDDDDDDDRKDKKEKKNDDDKDDDPFILPIPFP